MCNTPFSYHTLDTLVHRVMSYPVFRLGFQPFLVFAVHVVVGLFLFRSKTCTATTQYKKLSEGTYPSPEW